MVREPKLYNPPFSVLYAQGSRKITQVAQTKKNLCKEICNHLNKLKFLKWTCKLIINFRDIKMASPANNLGPGYTAHMCRLALLYTSGKGLCSY